MDQACIILFLLLPYPSNGQLGLLSSFLPGGITSSMGGNFFPTSITSLSNFIPLGDSPVTSPPSPDTTTCIDPKVVALGANAGLDLVSGILAQTGDKTAAKVGSILQVGNTLINDLEAIREYQLSKTTTVAPPPKPLKGLIGPDGTEYVIIDGRLYSLPSIQGAVPITQSPFPPSPPPPPSPPSPPPFYVPYSPSTLHLPKSPSRPDSPFYAYCPLLTRYGDKNVWCFLYDKRMQRVGYGYRREGEGRREEESESENALGSDSVSSYDPSLFTYIVI